MDVTGVRLPRFGRRTATAAASLVLVGGGALVSPFFMPNAEAVKSAAAPKPTVTQTVTQTVTATVTVTSPPQTVTTTVTAPPQTVTQTVTVTALAASTTTVPATTTTTTTPPPSSNWPHASNTGVPDGTVLTVVNGDYTVSTANATVDALDIRGTLRINADGVTVTRVKVANTVTSDTLRRSFTISDSELHSASVDFKVLANDANFTVLRSEISGGNSGGMCSDCLLKDNWIHNPVVRAANDTHHLSAFRMRQRATFTHNTIACEAPQSSTGDGCSAGLTGYGDYEPFTNNLIESNLFQGMPYASFCAYGGASTGKPYSGQDHDIVFRNNVFARGSTGKCAVYAAIGDFNLSRPGNQLVGNTWDDGTAVTPSDIG